ncbi:unnamed protein product, partial [Rotaria sordida]
MFIKCCSKLSIRRCRQYLFYTIFIILSFSLFLNIKYGLINHSSETTNKILLQNESLLLFKESTLNCSGDPLEQWCQHQIKLCNSSLIVYNKLFIITHSIILQPEFAQGKRLGGENIQDVLNQPEEDEYFHFQKEFIKLPCDIQEFHDRIPDGHLSNIFSAISSYRLPQKTHTIYETTIAVNRQDYVNVYHTITDVYTVYLLCCFFQRNPKSVRILFLDAHPKGNLDILWS